MITPPEYAQMSLVVYKTVDKSNEIKPPIGWELAEPLHADGLDGFSYGVFRRIGTTEIVLAYAGTNEAVDWAANITNGFGLSSTQTTQAATAYLQAKQQYGSNITLTGHSLGGGLASVMAVWFDRPADYVWGGLGSDVIDGEADNDQIQGLGGSDYLLGGDGNDVIFGDANPLGARLLLPVDYSTNTTLAVSPLQNPKDSEHGDDVIDGGSGDDKVWGDGGGGQRFADRRRHRERWCRRRHRAGG